MRAAVVFLILATASARADAPPSDLANRERQRAQTDEQAGKYEAAIGHYLRAHDIAPEPHDRYAIAADYERLGDARQAAEWYRRYLEAAPDAPDRDRIAQVLVDLKARPSPLSVRSIADGGLVAIDDQPAGEAPLVVMLPGGEHRIAVQLGDQRVEHTVTLEYGEPADIAFALGAPAGTIAVESTPAGALVAIDGTTVGKSPTHALVGVGPHDVRIVVPGFAPFESHVDVADGATVRVAAQLALAAPPAPPVPVKKPEGASLVSFLAGGVIGGEINGGAGYTAMGMIGSRISRYDLVFRLGRAHGTFAYDFMARAQILNRSISPYVAIGYTYSEGGYGYIALGGVRWDIVRKPRSALSLLLEGGIRDAPFDSSTSTATHVVVDPIEVGIEGLFR